MFYQFIKLKEAALHDVLLDHLQNAQEKFQKWANVQDAFRAELYRAMSHARSVILSSYRQIAAAGYVSDEMALPGSYTRRLSPLMEASFFVAKKCGCALQKHTNRKVIHHENKHMGKTPLPGAGPYLRPLPALRLRLRRRQQSPQGRRMRGPL